MWVYFSGCNCTSLEKYGPELVLLYYGSFYCVVVLLSQSFALTTPQYLLYSLPTTTSLTPTPYLPTTKNRPGGEARQRDLRRLHRHRVAHGHDRFLSIRRQRHQSVIEYGGQDHQGVEGGWCVFIYLTSMYWCNADMYAHLFTKIYLLTLPSPSHTSHLSPIPLLPTYYIYFR